jgi:hypothetical protein
MGGFGVMQHAKQVMEANRNLLKRPGIFAKLKVQTNFKKRTQYEFKEATPEVIAAIRLKMQADNEEGKRKRKLIMAVLVALGIFTLILIFN